MNIKKLFLIIGIVGLLSGCEKNEQMDITECSLTNNNIEASYVLNSEYKIYSKNDIVTRIDIDETVTSSSIAILDYFENYFTTTYNNSNKNYGGYKNKIIKENDELKSTTTINYKEVDLKKYAEEHSNIKDYFNNNKELTLEGAKAIYTTLGAICK